MIRKFFSGQGFPARLVHRVGKRIASLKDDNWQVPVVCSLFLHGLLVVGFFVVMPASEERRVNPAPSFVTARVVTVEQPKPQPVRKPAPKPVPSKPPVKQPVAKPKPQPDREAIALKRKQEEERQKKQAEQKRREEEQRRLAQKRERERLERERREQLQKQQEQEMLAALAREQRAAEQASKDKDEAASYGGIIKALIESQWTRPASARRGMRVVLRIRMLPTGEVISVSVLSGSGNAAFDRSAVQAVERAAPFREVQSMTGRVFEDYFRSLQLEFVPEDLR